MCICFVFLPQGTIPDSFTISDEARAAAIMKEKRVGFTKLLLDKEAAAERQKGAKKAAEMLEFERRQKDRVAVIELQHAAEREAASASHRCTRRHEWIEPPGALALAPRTYPQGHTSSLPTYLLPAAGPCPSPLHASGSRASPRPRAVYANTGHAAGGLDPTIDKEEVKMFVPSTNEQPLGFRDSFTKPGGTRNRRLSPGDVSYGSGSFKGSGGSNSFNRRRMSGEGEGSKPTSVLGIAQAASPDGGQLPAVS